MVIDGLTQQIDYVLFAASAVGRADILLREHSTLFIWTLILQPINNLQKSLKLIDKIKLRSSKLHSTGSGSTYLFLNAVELPLEVRLVRDQLSLIIYPIF